MRGKATGTPDFPQYSGITPAYAGKRNRKRVCPAFCRDHPRLCGEKLIAISIFLCASGSPPPMRGKDEFDMDEVDDARITPAYAGKSSSWSTAPSWTRDHPRLCGEKPFWFVSAITLQGSPPPMRGKVLSQCFLVGVLRITPAYAGKSTQL